MEELLMCKWCGEEITGEQNQKYDGCCSEKHQNELNKMYK